MKTRLFMTLALCALVVSLFAQDVPTPANCQFAQIVVADGNADEWPMTWLDDDDKILKYNVCSDDNNLYIRLKTNDDMFKRKMAVFGFTVWMDAGGKKKKKLGLKFPTGTEAKERMDANREAHSPENQERMTAPERAERQKRINASLVNDIELIELIGLADDPLTSTRSGITNGIKLGIAADEDGAYVYEAIIPFKSYRLSKASIKDLGIGFETGRYVPPASKTPGSNSGMSSGFGGGGRGGYGGGYGGQGGYGMRGGGGGGNRGQGGQRFTEMSVSSSYWTTLKFK